MPCVGVFVCVCVCVCVCLCASVCVCVFVYVCVHVCVHVCACMYGVCVHMCMCVCMCVCVYMCVCARAFVYCYMYTGFTGAITPIKFCYSFAGIERQDSRAGCDCERVGKSDSGKGRWVEIYPLPRKSDRISPCGVGASNRY